VETIDGCDTDRSSITMGDFSSASPMMAERSTAPVQLDSSSAQAQRVVDRATPSLPLKHKIIPESRNTEEQGERSPNRRRKRAVTFSSHIVPSDGAALDTTAATIAPVLSVSNISAGSVSDTVIQWEGSNFTTRPVHTRNGDIQDQKKGKVPSKNLNINTDIILNRYASEGRAIVGSVHSPLHRAGSSRATDDQCMGLVDQGSSLCGDWRGEGRSEPPTSSTNEQDDLIATLSDRIMKRLLQPPSVRGETVSRNSHISAFI